ncbi:UNVERIFIED_CONTAM: SEC12-like protein 1 [Sesamum radiatum]|uniref:SEC12-like protein 1 n=1 Tax=Sesamum radiatum TaxID=300843 RepID=A0AAW2JXC7_SESRA
MDGGDAPGQGTVTCATWIRRPENAHLVVVGKSRPSSLEIFSYDPITTSLSAFPKAKYDFEEGVNPVIIVVHPSGDEFIVRVVWSGRQDKTCCKRKLLLQGIGLQKCLAFSIDGTRFATGGVVSFLIIFIAMSLCTWNYSEISSNIVSGWISRIFEWPNMRIILEEPRVHKSFRDMDFSLDSEFLASTSTDGSARIWNTNDGSPVATLTRNSDEKIELCRFSKDGTKPFLFCSVQRGNKPLTVVWDISTWKKIGHKRLLRKPASMMSISLDGKYLALGSKDGDICVVEVKKMEVRHWSKRLHLGSDITSLEFCPSERVVLTTSKEWGIMVTKLTVPADWKEWQIYVLLLGLFLASIIAFYIFFENSDSFWNFPVAKDPSLTPNMETILGDLKSDQNVWEAVDL